MKLIAETSIVRGSYPNLGMGPKTKLIADKDSIWNDITYSYQYKQNGKLTFKNELTSFCTAGFARIFGIKAPELKKIFGKNTVSRIRITIEVLDSEEWEYIK